MPGPRALLGLVLALLLAVPALPAQPAPPPAPAPDDLLGVALGGQDPVPAAVEPLQRFVPQAPGTVLHTQLLYGPFTVPPGWDMDRVVLDIPLLDGFVTSLHYDLVDAVTGERPTNLELHIHHALWFRLDPRHVDVHDYENWLFGTGEERTDLDLDARSAEVPGGPHYGFYFAPYEAQHLATMLHNKLTAPRTVSIVLNVTFVYGDAASIRDAHGCANVVSWPGEGCLAGADFHDLHGRLFGTLFDVPRDAQGSGTYLWPPQGVFTYTANETGTLVLAYGHLHVLGMETVLANLGSADAPCADLDHDGFPGVTLFRSQKVDRDPRAWPDSEEYQMTVSAPGFRAPIRAGDRIAQFALYANRDHAAPLAMSFGMTDIDPQQAPAPRGSEGCTLENTAPHLAHGAGDPTLGALNHAWQGAPLPLCGDAWGVACDTPVPAPTPGPALPVVTIAGFAYATGSSGFTGLLGQPTAVPRGQSLTFVNADFAALVRHSVTSCPWPCDGAYVANSPLPDGTFDSGNLGNVDPFNGEPLPGLPVWSTPPDLAPGLYAYYCRIHPVMRGAFEVV